MTQQELEAALKTLGLPVVYSHFSAPVSPPYITYLEATARAWGSDEKNGIRATEYQVELYMAKKDLALQDRLEALFDERGIEWSLFEAYIEAEKLFQAVYTVAFTTKIRRI